MGLNVGLSIVVILINVVLLYMLHVKMIAIQAIDDSSARFQEAVKAAGSFLKFWHKLNSDF